MFRWNHRAAIPPHWAAVGDSTVRGGTTFYPTLQSKDERRSEQEEMAPGSLPEHPQVQLCHMARSNLKQTPSVNLVCHLPASEFTAKLQYRSKSPVHAHPCADQQGRQYHGIHDMGRFSDDIGELLAKVPPFLPPPGRQFSLMSI